MTQIKPENMTKQEILEKIQHGDYVTVGKMLGISSVYAKKLIDRDNAKKHHLAIKALREVIETREALIARAYGEPVVV